MNADCEVVVDRHDLRLAVGCAGPARSPLGPDELMIWPTSSRRNFVCVARRRPS